MHLRYCLALLPLVLAAPVRAEEPVVACHVLLPPTPLPHHRGLMVEMIGLEVPPLHDAHRHQHDAAEIMHVVSGKGRLSIDGKPDVTLNPDMTIMVPPKTPHQQHNIGSTPLVYTSTFIAGQDERTITAYLGEPDRSSGCPHRLPGGRRP